MGKKQHHIHHRELPLSLPHDILLQNREGSGGESNMEIMLQTSTLQEYKQLRGWCCVLDFHFGFVSFFVCLVLNLLLGFVCLFFILTKMTKKELKKTLESQTSLQ